MTGLRVRHAVRLRVEPSVDARPLLYLDQIESGTGRLLGDLDIAQPAGAIRFEPGDVLFSKLRPYLAKSLLVRAPLQGTGELLAMVPDPRVDRGFLLYVTLSQPWLELAAITSYGTKMPRTSWDAMSDFLLPEVSVGTQRRIAEFLDDQVTRIDNIIAAREAQIDQAAELAFAQLRRFMNGKKPANGTRGMQATGVQPTWQTAALRYVARIQRGASPRPIDDPRYFDDEGTHGWVRISDVTASRKYLEGTEQRLSAVGVSMSVPLDVNELILSISASVGKPAITRIPCCIHDGFLAIREPKVDREFLYYWFLLGDCFAGLGKLGTQLNLNSDIVGDINVPLPSVAEQHEVVRLANHEMDNADAAVSHMREQMGRFHELKRSLITAAVTGAFDVSAADGSRVLA